LFIAGKNIMDDDIYAILAQYGIETFIAGLVRKTTDMIQEISNDGVGLLEGEIKIIHRDPCLTHEEKKNRIMELIKDPTS
jgi:hypothetical protein